MKLKAIIEIPKDNDQRWHLDYFSPEIKNFGPIKSVIPINDGKMPVAYGYIENVFNHEETNEDGIKENLDVLVFSNKDFGIGESIDVTPFAMFVREDGDHKVISRDETFPLEKWKDISLVERELLLEFFGYKSKIKEIVEKNKTEEYITLNSQ